MINRCENILAITVCGNYDKRIVPLPLYNLPAVMTAKDDDRRNIDEGEGRPPPSSWIDSLRANDYASYDSALDGTESNRIGKT